MFRRIGLVIFIIAIPQTHFANDCKTSLTEEQRKIWYPDSSSTSTSNSKLHRVPRKDVDKFNKLTRAAYAGNLKKVKYLVKVRGVSVNQQEGLLAYTPLMFAAGEDHTHVVEYLLANDEIDVNQLNDFWSTALIEAASKNNKSFKLILDHPDTDVNIQDANGMTALMFISWRGDLHNLNLLLQMPDIDITISDNEGNTALAWALKEWNFGAIKAIIEKYESLKTKKKLPPKAA